MKIVRPFFLGIALLVTLGFSIHTFAASNDTFVFVKSVPNGLTTTDWYFYRNTLVALSDNGNAMCTINGLDDPNCQQMRTTDLPTLQNIASTQSAAGNVLICDSPLYQSMWGAVPKYDPTHWCNTVQKEAFTLRVVINNGVVVVNKPVISHNLAGLLHFNKPNIGFFLPPQGNVSGVGFDRLIYAANIGWTPIQFYAPASKLVLRASRLAGCKSGELFEKPMHDAGPCIKDFDNINLSQLKIALEPEDTITLTQAPLPKGHIVGSFKVNAVEWFSRNSGNFEELTVYVDFTNE